jgi:hypothetical protein
MSDEHFYTGVMPILLIFIIVIYFVTRLLFLNYKEIITKILIRYLTISIIIVFFFSFFYVIIFIGDYQALQDQLNLEKLTMTKEMLGKLPHINGLDFSSYETNYFLIFFDFIFYSASIFFQFDSPIKILGAGQTIVIIERLFGAIVPIIIVIVSMNKRDDTNKENNHLLSIYLNRGWNILKRRKSDVLKGYIIVDLVSPDLEIEQLILKDNSEIKEILRHFKINWSKASLDLIPFFSKTIEEPLKLVNYDLFIKAMKFFYERDHADNEYYMNYYVFLKSLKNDLSFIRSGVEYTDLEQVINTLSVVTKSNESMGIISPNEAINNE